MADLKTDLNDISGRGEGFNPFAGEFNVNGKNLIEASAGTGKTYSIAAIYLRLILESGSPGAGDFLNPKNILVVTFTIEATEELKERIRRILKTSHGYLKGMLEGETGAKASGHPCEEPDDSLRAYLDGFKAAGPSGIASALARLKEALLFFDEAAIYTIHRFCKKVLSENPVDTGNAFEQNLLTEDGGLVRGTLYDFYRKWLYGQNAQVISYFIREYYSGGAVSGGRASKLENMLHRYFLSVEPRLEVPEIPPKTIEELYEELADLFFEFKEGYLGKINTGEIKKSLAYLDDFFGQEGLIKTGAADLRIPPDKGFEKYCPGFREKYDGLARSIDLYIKKSIMGHVEDMAEHYHGLEITENSLTFDRMVRSVYDAVKSGNIDAKRYESLKVLLIDEFQDTDFLQVEIFDKIFEGKTVFYIGDPKQSIYSFRGADLDAYFYATGGGGIKKFDLTVSYRSTENLIRNFNKIFSKESFFSDGSGSRIEYKKANVPDKQKLHVYVKNGVGGIALDIAPVCGSDFIFYRSRGSNKKDVLPELLREIRLLLGPDSGYIEENGGTRRIRPIDIAIITASNGDAVTVKDYLAGKGVKSVLNSTESVFETDEAKELYLFFDAVENYSDSRKIKSALTSNIFNKPVKGLSGVEIIAYKEKFGLYRKRLEKKGVFPLFEHIFKEEGTMEHILGKINGERIYTNYIHLLELLQSAAANGSPAVESVKKWLEDRMSGREKEPEGYELRLESDMDALKIATIHGSKGLEYPVVFLVYFNYEFKKDRADFFLSDFDRSSGRHIIKAVSGGAGMKALADKDRAEKARLFYVALTRAMGRCYVFDYNRKKKDIYLDGFIGAEDYVAAEEAEGGGCEQAGSERSATGGHNDKVNTGLIFKEFNKNAVRRKYGLTSYSSITSAAARREPDRADEYLGESYNAAAVAASANGYPGVPADEYGNRLPYGAAYGNAVHKLLAEIRYDISDEELAGRIKNDPSVSGEGGAAAGYTFRMIKNVLDLPRLKDESGVLFSLRDVGEQDKINEMEFLMPVGDVNAFFGRLYEILSRRADERCGKFAESLKYFTGGGADYGRFKSYLKGFIDLVFMRGGKYYLIDWKTNYLGSDAAAYSGQSLVNAMSGENYYLQLIIYQLALYRQLKWQSESMGLAAGGPATAGNGPGGVLRGSGYEEGGAMYGFTRGFLYGNSGETADAAVTADNGGCPGGSGSTGVFKYGLSPDELDELEGQDGL